MNPLRVWHLVWKRTEGETVPTSTKEVIRQTVPRTLHGRLAKVVGRKTPILGAPPPKPPPARRLDALQLLHVWRAAVDSGHRTQAAAALAGLEELARRPEGRAEQDRFDVAQ